MCTSAIQPGQALLKREEEENRFSFSLSAFSKSTPAYGIWCNFAFTSYLVLFWDSNPTKDSWTSPELFSLFSSLLSVGAALGYPNLTAPFRVQSRSHRKQQHLCVWGRTDLTERMRSAVALNDHLKWGFMKLQVVPKISKQRKKSDIPKDGNIACYF